MFLMGYKQLNYWLLVLSPISPPLSSPKTQWENLQKKFQELRANGWDGDCGTPQNTAIWWQALMLTPGTMQQAEPCTLSWRVHVQFVWMWMRHHRKMNSSRCSAGCWYSWSPGQGWHLHHEKLGGDFRYFWFSSLLVPGKMIQFDYIIFFTWGWNSTTNKKCVNKVGFLRAPLKTKGFPTIFPTQRNRKWFFSQR